MKRFPMPATTLTTLNLKKTAFTLFCCTVLMLVLAGAPIAVAQSPSFTDFSSITNLTLNGSAKQYPIETPTVLRLTPAATQQRGSAWFNILQPVRGGFTTTFTFQITDANPTTGNFPADGLAFVIQNSAANTAALGQAGGAIGYGGSVPPTPTTLGIENSLAVEFDTYANPWDPNANHVAVQSCGPEPNTADHTATRSDSVTSCKLAINSSPINLADGQPHTVKIEYTSSSECGDCSSHLQVTLGNSLVLSVNVDLGTLLNLANPSDTTADSAYVGFTAATGAFVENNDILSWTFTPHTSTTIEENIPPGQQGVFNFGSFNYKVTNPNNTALDLIVTANPLLPNTVFPSPGGQCIVYAGTGGNCWGFDVHCPLSGCTASTANLPLATSYDSDQPASYFVSPGFLKIEPDCAAIATGTATDQITDFLFLRKDPTTKGTSGGGISCWVATVNTTPFVAAVQQPINADGSSVFNAKRGVVPVKFTITMKGSPTCTLPPATIVVTRTAGGSTQGTIDESLYMMAADNGSYFRISGCQYIYNLAAAALGPGTYRVDIYIAGLVVPVSATFVLQ
jgi:hypothetical protein